MSKKRSVKQRLWLASQSPRRRELLRKRRIPFRVVASRYEERTARNVSPARLVKQHALGKAKGAWKTQSGVVLGADTVVYCRGRILGKPKSRKEAVRMLRLLSGRAHSVYTGLALFSPETGKTLVRHAKTIVLFKPLTKEDINRYLERIHPYDKAGSYAIQTGSIVRALRGSYTNVVGLPMELLSTMLKQFDPIPK